MSNNPKEFRTSLESKVIIINKIMSKIMKIEKIRIIENPIEDFQLSQESMNALLGGDFCNGRVGNYCHEYQSGLSCVNNEGTKCNRFSW